MRPSGQGQNIFSDLEHVERHFRNQRILPENKLLKGPKALTTGKLEQPVSSVLGHESGPASAAAPKLDKYSLAHLH
jgi:hypothetical protein